MWFDSTRDSLLTHSGPIHTSPYVFNNNVYKSVAKAFSAPSRLLSDEDRTSIDSETNSSSSSTIRRRRRRRLRFDEDEDEDELVFDEDEYESTSTLGRFEDDSNSIVELELESSSIRQSPASSRKRVKRITYEISTTINVYIFGDSSAEFCHGARRAPEKG